jgi:signal transduction histidine kinase
MRPARPSPRRELDQPVDQATDRGDQDQHAERQSVVAGTIDGRGQLVCQHFSSRCGVSAFMAGHATAADRLPHPPRSGTLASTIRAAGPARFVQEDHPSDGFAAASAALVSVAVRAATAQGRFGARSRSGSLIDAAIALVALVGSLAQLSHGGIGAIQSGAGELDWTAGLLAAGSAVPLLAWRYAPRGVFALTASACVLLGALGYPLGLPLGPTAALYLLASSRDEEDAWTPRDTAMVVTLFLVYLAATAVGDGGFPGSELLHAGLAWAVAWFAGERTRLLREQFGELRERARRAEREGQRERRLAAAEERARIARDLHDAAGHTINVIALRAGAARLRQDPERSQATLAAIEELARKTVGEIDQIVGTLRDRGSGNGAVDVPPGLASLDTLIARHAAAGLDIRLASEGKPRPLETAVDQALYRILQEALTNAARYGAGAARVELAFGTTALELTVTNPAAGEIAPRENGGHGLIGMRERANLLGGSLKAERTGGTFRVRAHLPYGGLRP